MVYGAHAEVYGAHAEPQPRMLVECPDESRPHTQAVEGDGYALHEARENDSVPDARVCNHDCGHGGSCELRTSLGPIFLGRSGWLGRSKVGGVGLGRSVVWRLGRPLSLGAPLSAIAAPRFFISVLRRAPQSSSASRRLLEGAAAA